MAWYTFNRLRGTFACCSAPEYLHRIFGQPDRDSERPYLRHIEGRLSISIFNQFRLDSAYAASKTIHISKCPHCIGNNRIAVIVLVREIVAVHAPVQTARIEDFNPNGALTGKAAILAMLQLSAGHHRISQSPVVGTAFHRRPPHGRRW